MGWVSCQAQVCLVSSEEVQSDGVPHLDGEGGAGESSVVAKGGNTPARLVLEELEVVQDAAAAGETSQDLLPAALLLVAVGKVHHGVLERPVLLGQLLQADDDVVLGRLCPRALGDERGAGILEFPVLEDALVVGVGGAALDIDLVAGGEQLLGGGGCEAGAVLKGLGLGAGVQCGKRHGFERLGGQLSCWHDRRQVGFIGGRRAEAARSECGESRRLALRSK